MKIRIILFFALLIFPVIALAQTTEFTYQGRLLDNNLPPTAVYDFEFRLFDAETGGEVLGTLQRAPGDYDGDGKFDFAVFRPSETNWYVQKSGGGMLIQAFGLATDTPAPAAFVP
jgi:hypothetical protein